MKTIGVIKNLQNFHKLSQYLDNAELYVKNINILLKINKL